jgi:transposase-like protein
MGNRARATGSGTGRQWKAEDGRAALVALASSGESMSQFARRRGISMSRLFYWKKRLAETTEPAGFVEVPASALGRSHIEIAHGGVVIRVREDIAIERLSRIVEALGGRRLGC